MKSATVFLASLVAGVAVAQPHNHDHQHAHKRGEEVVWVTDLEYVTETVGVTKTVWVSSGFVPPTTSETSATVSESPAQFFEPSSAVTSPTTLSTSTTSTYVAPPPPPPTTTSIYVAPTPTSTTEEAPTTSTSEYVAPTSTYVAPTYVAPTTETTPPAPTTTAPAPAATSASSSSSSGTCSEGSPCDGDITYYTAGLGACGLTSDGDTENVIALPFEFMGTQSNGNPYCGKTVTIKCTSTGKTTTATVVDKCMGCTGFSIDLSNAAFLELADLSVGRTTAEWWFN